MTEEQLQYSKVIVGFMGDIIIFDSEEDMRAYPILELTSWCYSWQCQYHTSYDWLMPVWVKFRDLEKVVPLAQMTECTRLFSNIEKAIVHKPIDQLFEALAEAIIWYNQTKK